MSRTKAQNDARAEACRRYRETVDKCELAKLLEGDFDAQDWMRGVSIRQGLEVHHIAGRGRTADYESFTNLIVLNNRVHLWLTDQESVGGEILCLAAKHSKHELEKLFGMNFEKLADPTRQEWNEDILGRIYSPHPSVRARLSFLMDKLDCESRYWKIGLELLRELEGKQDD